MKQRLLLLLAIATACYGCKTDPPRKPVVSSPDFEKGEALYQRRNDSAFYFFNEVINISTDTQQLKDAFSYMAAIQEEVGDYYGSQESLTRVLKFLDETRKSDYYSLSYVNTMLGNTSLNLKNYDAAINYYELGEKFATDTNMLLFPANGKALVYQKKRDFDASVKIYESLIGKSVNNQLEHARILSNLARARWLRDPSYPAGPEFIKAMTIRKEHNDNRGLNASYAHLSDYYAPLRPDSALYYARKMLDVAKLNNSPDDILEAIQKLIHLGPAKDAKKYFEVYHHLNDSIQTARNNAKNQYAPIRFQIDKSKAENLVLQKDNAEKHLQIIWQNIILYSVIAIVGFVASIAVYWYRKRKHRMEREKREAIQESELKMSRKVHDVVANGLYSLMSSLEHDAGMDGGQLQDKLEILYEKSRNISHEIPERPTGGFQETIATILSDFSSPLVKVSMVGNNNELWQSVPINAQKELESILQELMVNMKKHSQAKNVAVKFERQDNRVSILYQDDGIGLSAPLTYGKGLKNTETRIKNIKGQISFDQVPSKGLKIRISFPIQTQNA